MASLLGRSRVLRHSTDTPRGGVGRPKNSAPLLLCDPGPCLGSSALPWKHHLRLQPLQAQSGSRGDSTRKVRLSRSRHAAALDVLRRVTYQATLPVPSEPPEAGDGLLLRSVVAQHLARACVPLKGRGLSREELRQPLYPRLDADRPSLDSARSRRCGSIAARCRPAAADRPAVETHGHLPKRHTHPCTAASQRSCFLQSVTPPTRLTSCMTEAPAAGKQKPL